MGGRSLVVRNERTYYYLHFYYRTQFAAESLSVIESICDHIIILNQGKVIAENEVKKLETEHAVNNHLVIVVKGNKSKISSLLKQSKLVRDYTYTREVESGVHEYRVITASDQDVRDEMFVLFSEAKMVVYSLNMEQLTLEDVFIKLTGKEEKE